MAPICHISHQSQCWVEPLWCPQPDTDGVSAPPPPWISSRGIPHGRGLAARGPAWDPLDAQRDRHAKRCSRAPPNPRSAEGRSPGGGEDPPSVRRAQSARMARAVRWIAKTQGPSEVRTWARGWYSGPEGHSGAGRFIFHVCLRCETPSAQIVSQTGRGS